MADTASLQQNPPVDGRTARAVRTRDAIVDACIALVDGGDLKPTAPRIAEEAGVSVRSVFQHFDDLETLFSAVGSRVVQRLEPLFVPIDPSLPLDDRVEALVEQRCRVLEAVTPVRRAAIVNSVESPQIGRLLQEGHDALQRQVADVFATELAAAACRGSDDGASAQELLDSLGVALAWSTWETLRLFGRRDDRAARGVLDRLVRGVLRAEGHLL